MVRTRVMNSCGLDVREEERSRVVVVKKRSGWASAVGEPNIRDFQGLLSLHLSPFHVCILSTSSPIFLVHLDIDGALLFG